MGFEDRLTQTNTLINLVDEFLRSNPELMKRLVVVPFGYETHIPKEIRTKLRFIHSTTAHHIKFAPDFFLVDNQDPALLYLHRF